jgi:hypothetical protein
MEDVHYHKDRVTLHLKASKTDPFREGVDIHDRLSLGHLLTVLLSGTSENQIEKVHRL